MSKTELGITRKKPFSICCFLHFAPKYLCLEKEERSELKSNVIFINFGIERTSVQESV